MKKYLKFKLLFILSVVMLAISCEESSQDVEPIISTDSYPLATFSSDPLDINEAGSPELIITVRFDKMINRPVTFTAVQVGGTAEVHEDYDVSEAIVEAYTNQAQFVVQIYEDATIEDIETLVLQIETPALSNRYLINPDSELPEYTIKINNYVSKSLDMTFDWDKLINFAGDDYHTHGNIDFDFYISTSPFALDDPFANILAVYDAATGNAPEELSISLDDYEDGEYYIFADNYSNGFAGLDTNTPVPVNTTFVQGGLFSQTLTQDPSQVLNSDTPGGAEGGNFQGYIAKITIANGGFVIDGTVPAGKMAGSKNAAGNLSKTQKPDVSSRK
ncbi:MAG: hypothetical protein U5K51_12330 [Flavobacteriaceae bacterium]|nr:hypothetical protein [Flavobacteriaceae bacterium]